MYKLNFLSENINLDKGTIDIGDALVQERDIIV